MSTAIATERVPLSFLLAENSPTTPPVEPVLPFQAWRETSDLEKRDHDLNSDESMFWRPIVITGLLERTAAFHELNDRYDTGVIRLDLVHVEPYRLKWQTSRTKQHQHPFGNNHSVAKGRQLASGMNSQQRRAEIERQRANERARREEIQSAKQTPSTTALKADEAKGETPAMASPATRTCRVCGKEKTTDNFPATGKNARRCFECAAAAAELVNPKPVKKAPIKSPAKSLLSIPAESQAQQIPTLVLVEQARHDIRRLEAGLGGTPLVPEPSNGHAATVDDALVSQIKNLIAERNTLRAQLDAIEAALVHA